MKNILFTLLILGSFTFTFAQKSNDAKQLSTINLGPKEDVNSITSVNDFGFILTTSIGYTNSQKDVKIHSYTPSLTKRWTATIAKSSNTALNNYLVASKYSPFVYMVQTSKVFKMSNGSLLFTRIDSIGKKSEFKLPITEDMDEATPVALFQNKDNLYFLMTNSEYVESKVENEKGKLKNKTFAENKLVMYTMSHDKKTIKKRQTEIKLVSENLDEQLSIEYLGNTNENIYVAQKYVYLSAKSIKYIIYTLTNEGDIEETVQVEAKVDFIPLANMNFREGNGAAILNNDYTITQSQEFRDNKWQNVTTYTAFSGAFGCSQLDIENGYFYIYGLGISDNKGGKTANQKPLATTKTNNYGFYVQKFDLYSGDLMGENKGLIPIPLKDEKTFNSSKFIDLGLSFTIVDTSIVHVNFVTINNVSNVSLNMDTDKFNITSKEIKRRRIETLDHRLSQAPLLVSKDYTSKELFNHLNTFEDFRTKEFSVFGLVMGSKTAIIKNYSLSKNNPHLELSLFNSSPN